MTSPAAVDVECSCGHRFCFECCEEAHQPFTCATVRKWVEKNRNEAENMTWILANTKPCPKCKHPIEKNHGCMHMVCRCKHQFCWLCLADDFNYSTRVTGGRATSTSRSRMARRKRCAQTWRGTRTTSSAT